MLHFTSRSSNLTAETIDMLAIQHDILNNLCETINRSLCYFLIAYQGINLFAFVFTLFIVVFHTGKNMKPLALDFIAVSKNFEKWQSYVVFTLKRNSSGLHRDELKLKLSIIRTSFHIEQFRRFTVLDWHIFDIPTCFIHSWHLCEWKSGRRCRHILPAREQAEKIGRLESKKIHETTDYFDPTTLQDRMSSIVQLQDQFNNHRCRMTSGNAFELSQQCGLTVKLCLKCEGHEMLCFVEPDILCNLMR